MYVCLNQMCYFLVNNVIWYKLEHPFGHCNVFIWDTVLWQIKPRLGVSAEILQHLFTNFFQLHCLLLGESFFLHYLFIALILQ